MDTSSLNNLISIDYQTLIPLLTCSICNGMSKRLIERPTLEILKKEIQESGYRGIGKKYGVSDNTIRKWVYLYKSAIKSTQ